MYHNKKIKAVSALLFRRTILSCTGKCCPVQRESKWRGNNVLWPSAVVMPVVLCETL